MNLEEVINTIREIKAEYDEDNLDDDCELSVDYTEGWYDACNRVISRLKSNYNK